MTFLISLVLVNQFRVLANLANGCVPILKLKWKRVFLIQITFCLNKLKKHRVQKCEEFRCSFTLQFTSLRIPYAFFAHHFLHFYDFLLPILDTLTPPVRKLRNRFYSCIHCDKNDMIRIIFRTYYLVCSLTRFFYKKPFYKKLVLEMP